MFECAQCGSRYNATVAAAFENCPRCKAKGIEAPLCFRLFEERVNFEEPRELAAEEASEATTA